eukprot:2709789-Alexandrium_andersonii.AAC.1
MVGPLMPPTTSAISLTMPGSTAICCNMLGRRRPRVMPASSKESTVLGGLEGADAEAVGLILELHGHPGKLL